MVVALKTVVEWEIEYDTLVVNADGFPNGTNRHETLLTEHEFVESCKISTVKLSEKLLKAMG